jgi:hypothetical protein
MNELSKEMSNLRTNSSKLDNELKEKNKEIELLKKNLEKHIQIYETNQKVDDKLKVSFLFIYLRYFALNRPFDHWFT